MTSRLQLGGNLAQNSDSIHRFCNLTASREDIRNVWQLIAPDLDLAVLADEYCDIQMVSAKPTEPRQTLHKLCSLSAAGQLSNSLTTAFARIIVCKPHSADCERMISAYNRLKSVSRSSLDHKTISNYLYVYANMPTLCSYDPRPSVLQWITDKERRHRDTPKASAQQWFKTVFCNDDCNNENVADVSGDKNATITTRKRQF